MPARHAVAADAPPTPIELRSEALGIKFTRGRTHTPNSHLALEAAEFAFEQGDSWQFHRAMLKAYFEDLKDIGDIATIVEVATSTGLPEGPMREALLDRSYRDRVDEGITWSKQIGVSAIPTFVLDQRYGIVGAQELPAFREMLQKLGHPPKA